MDNLLPDSLRRTIPQLYFNDDKNISANEMLVYAKFFCGSYTWYLAECSEEDGRLICYGFVDSDFPELGYFTIDEFLDFNRNHAYPQIERDLYFGDPKPLSVVLGRNVF